MAILPIQLFPDPILRKPAKTVALPQGKLNELIRNLIETLEAQPGGIGIAAPQIGEPWRVIVIDLSRRDPSKRRLVMINPVVVSMHGEMLIREGCMSLPNYTANIKRARCVKVAWEDPTGASPVAEMQGLEGVCVQHEVDHLGGIVFLDRVASLKTEVFVRRGRNLGY